MLTPSSAASVNSSAAAPVRSGIGIRTSAIASGWVTRPGRLVRASRALCERAVQRVAVLAVDDVADVAQSIDQPVEGGDDRRPVLGADVEPDAGMPAGDAGHVTEAAGSQPQQGGVLLGAVGGERHQRRRREVGDVADTATT